MTGWLRVLQSDLLGLCRSRISILALAFLMSGLALAVWQGLSTAQTHRAALDRYQHEIEAKQTTLVPPLQATAIRLPAVLPDGPLSALSVGRTRLDPAYANIHFFARTDQLFSNYQITAPVALQSGSFDLGFVIAVVVPVVMIAMGAGLLQTERDSGRLRLLLASGARPITLLVPRLALRAALVAVPVFLAAFAVAAASGGLADGGARLAIWIGQASIYMALWWSVIALVNTMRVRSESASALLVAIWVVGTWLAPGGVVAVAANIAPPPSRQGLIADIRRAQVAATAAVPESLSRYAHDHPEMLHGAGEVEQWIKSSGAVRLSLDRYTAKPLAAFDRAYQRQASIARGAEFVLPILALQRSLDVTAGTDQARCADFRRQAVAYKTQVQDVLTTAGLSGRPLSAEEVSRLEPFRFKEAHGGRPPGPTGAMIWWLLVALAFAAAATRQARTVVP